MQGDAPGTLTVVGTGITVSGQMTLITENIITHAEVVLAVVTDSALLNLKSLNSNVVNLRDYYQEGAPRLDTYQKMKQRIVDEVVSGKKVVAAFYGHPGVFVNPSHAAIAELSEMGYQARMLPGVSAEDCLVADLGLDPSYHGCQSYEATQFLFRQYHIDPHMLQIIWQIGSIADFSYRKQKIATKGLQVLRDVLLQSYPADHEVIVYEAATIPLAEPRKDKLPLSELPGVSVKGISTLVIPSIGLPDFDRETMAKFGFTPERFAAQVTTKRHAELQSTTNQ